MGWHTFCFVSVLDHDLVHKINFTVHYSSIPCMIRRNVILGNDLSRSHCVSIPCILYLHFSFYHICPLKCLISVKVLHWVSWESRLALTQMTAAASFTRRTVDRRGNSADLSGSTAELTGWVAPAINISADNIHSCLFFPKLSVSVTDLFWKWLLFWQIWGMTATVCVHVLHVCQP